MSRLLSVAEAREHILSKFVPVDSMLVQVSEGSNRVLAKPIIADKDFPPFDNSSIPKS